MAQVGMAVIKPEYLVPYERNRPVQIEEPALKRTKVEGAADMEVVEGMETDAADLQAAMPKEGDDDEASEDTAEKAQEQDTPRKLPKKERRGQNKHRPRTQKLSNSQKLCRSLTDGPTEENCALLPGCPFLHDVKEYLEMAKDFKCLDKECYLFKTYGKCVRGLSCVFSNSHVDADGRNLVNTDLWNQMKPIYESQHRTILDKETQQKLRRRKFDFKAIDKICNSLQADNRKDGEMNVEITAVSETELSENLDKIRTCGAITDEDIIPTRKVELKKVDWSNKLYLSPLTTVGNLPFRRVCVDFGADITCSEMSLASSIVQGNAHEFALHRRHPSEKIWGVQLCSNNPIVAVKASHILAELGVDYDFVDMNMGCPLDPIFRQGLGSGLMCRTGKLRSITKGMSELLETHGKPFTVKMRAGVKTDNYIAHNLIRICRDSGVSMVTLHGRTREQRYTKTANWDYIGECMKVANPMPLYGNGDILSWEEYAEKKNRTNVSGVMIGRGALMKPWIFQEIKEQRNIDLNSTQRVELLQRFSNYGLDHWGSDSQGVETTRRFLLEWLSFYHRYIPHGILEHPPQKINQKPPKYVGRDEMETLLASGNSADWIKISEMLLGRVPDHFAFLPKHKAASWT